MWLMYLKTLFVVVVVACAIEQDTVRNGSTEERLIEDLLRGYNKFAHPKSYNTVQDYNFSVIFGIEIVQLVAVEDRNQRITTNCWVRQRWNNRGLQWDPSNYENITKIRLSGEKVWIPDIFLYNSADTQQASGGLTKYQTSIIVDHTGNHSWFAPASFISTCQINVRYFPFDSQRCIMKFGSWTFQTNDLDILGDNKPAVTSAYLRSAEWDMVGVRESRNVIQYLCCKYPYSDLTLTIEISRRPLFYIFNLMLPCFIIITMVLMGFFLPPESGERITLSITVLLAMAVFLQLQSEYLPRNSEHVPLLGIFYITVMAEIALSLLATCYVLNIFHKNPGVHVVPMNPVIGRFFLGTLAQLLRVSPPAHYHKTTENDAARPYTTSLRDNDVQHRAKAETDTQIHLIGQRDRGENCDMINGIGVGAVLRSHRAPKTKYSPSKRSLGNSLSSTAIGNDCCGTLTKSVAQSCSILAENMKHKHDIKLNQEQWKFLAMVLDRMFFVIFVITIILSTLLIYFKVED